MKRKVTLLLTVILMFSCSEKQENIEKEVVPNTETNSIVTDTNVAVEPKVTKQTKEVAEPKKDVLHKEIQQEKDNEKAIDFLKYDLSVENRSMMETDLVTATIKNTHNNKTLTKVQFRFIGLDEDNNQVHTQVLTINSDIKPTNSKSLKIDEEKLNLDCKKYKIQFISADFK